MPMHAYVSHHSAGRLRLRIPEARRNSESLKRMAQAVRGIPGVRSAEYNPVTGSLLIKYTEKMVHDLSTFIGAISDSGLPLDLVGTLSGSEEIAQVEKYSEAAKSISSFLSDVDEAVKYATNNQIDLKILLPIGAAIAGLSSLRNAGASTPLWLTLMLFAFTSYTSLHDKQDADATTSRSDRVSGDRYLH